MTKTRLAALALAAPLLLAACGGSTDTATSATTNTPTSAGSGSAASGAAAADLGSAQPGQTVDKNAFVEAVSKGTAAAKTYAMNMTMEMSGQQTGTVTMTGVANVSDQANPKMKMTMEMPGAGGGPSQGNVEMLFIDKVMYMKMPGTAGKYYKMTMAEVSKMSGQDLTQAMNPTAQLEQMKSSMKQVTYVGEEDVNGTKTRHYKAVIDSAGISPSMTATASSMSPPKEMPYDIWLDDQNRTRKFTMEMAVSGMTITYNGTLDKFGEPVTVTAPPASQVQPMPNPTATSSAKG